MHGGKVWQAMPTDGHGELWSEPEGLEVRSFATLAELVAAFPAQETAAEEALASPQPGAGDFKGFEVHMIKSGGHIDARVIGWGHAVWGLKNGEPGSLHSGWVMFGPVDNWLTMSRLLAGEIERPSYRESSARAAFVRALDATKGAAASIERLADLAARRPELSPVVALVLQVTSEAFRAGRYMREAELAERFELDIEAQTTATEQRRKGAYGAIKTSRKNQAARRDEVWHRAREILSAWQPSPQKPWSRERLAGEVCARWKWEDEYSHRTIADDLTELGFKDGILPPLNREKGDL